ncbi:transcriptional regulator [Chryseobacterium aahli]|uniref:GbsR/MarR family transcriptional regulator n=1 Tax=Chryseobacterium TaxID=59732 RepID=UPI000F0C0E4B|nr:MULTISPECIES: transcriptional regulator [Chryseobacterium]AYN02493.1 transcriptional regulator [Chryseobacterium sp. 3008163]MCI3936218.1 transcriptional regulator [Chryseobacterium aahli]
MNKSIEIDEKIFQDAVKFCSTMFNLPPLASKIYSYLIFDFEKVGITFDEFVDVFSASKSSVSTNIKLLLNAQLIIDVNKIDERRRYFYTNTEYKKVRFEKIVQKMQDELNLIEALRKFRKLKKVDDKDFEDKMEVYKSLLNKNIVNIQESLNKL